MTQRHDTKESLMEKTARLFDQMDQAYDAAARIHGFVCNGCRDNCCQTRFYHHTLVEYQYLKSGLENQSEGTRKRLRQTAADVVQKMNEADRQNRSVKIMCPLNQEGRCTLYAYRPMICRLHGIPHQLRRPDGQRQMGPGCDDFDRQCGPTNQPILDRTPLYMTLAALERELRQKTGFNRKIRMTIAEMIITDI